MKLLWTRSYLKPFRPHEYSLNKQTRALPGTACMLLVQFLFFSFQSLCHSAVRGHGWSTDSIGLSGALSIVFAESGRVKRAPRSTEGSHMYLVHSFEPCFLCVQGSHAVIDFLYLPLERLPSRDMHVLRTHRRGCRCWNTVSRKHRQSKHFLRLFLHENFPTCTMEKNRESRRSVIVREESFFLENFHRNVFFFEVLTHSLPKTLFTPAHSKETVNGR